MFFRVLKMTKKEEPEGPSFCFEPIFTCSRRRGSFPKSGSMVSKAEVDKIHAAHGLYAGRGENGGLAGFIGIHTEGSIGLLFVLPEQRRKGYAEELESFMKRGIFWFEFFAKSGK